MYFWCGSRRDSNFVSNETLRVVSFPPTISSSREHVFASWIDVKCTNNTRSRGARNDEKGDSSMLEGLRLLEIIKSEDIL